MRILTHKNFDRSFNKAPAKVQVKFYEQMEIFTEQEFDFRLRNHALSGKYSGTSTL